MVITPKRRALLLSLTHHVRFMLLHQVAAWAGYRYLSSARRFLLPLEKAGLLAKERTLIRPLPVVREPLAISGTPAPDIYKMVYAIRTRFQWPAKHFSLWVATQQAVNFVGGTSPKLVLAQATHDAHLTACYLAKLRSDPDQIADWKGEDCYCQSRQGDKLPDALLCRNGTPYRAIESAGCSYSANRIEAFIKYCNLQQLQWELW